MGGISLKNSVFSCSFLDIQKTSIMPPSQLFTSTTNICFASSTTSMFAFIKTSELGLLLSSPVASYKQIPLLHSCCLCERPANWVLSKLKSFKNVVFYSQHLDHLCMPLMKLQTGHAGICHRSNDPLENRFHQKHTCIQRSSRVTPVKNECVELVSHWPCIHSVVDK